MKHKCTACDSTVELRAEDIMTENTMNGDQKLVLTFHNCPACKDKVLVQVDTEETLAMLEEVQTLTTKKLFRMSKGLQMPKKQLERLVKLDKQLDYKRKELTSDYLGPLYPHGGLN